MYERIASDYRQEYTAVHFCDEVISPSGLECWGYARWSGRNFFEILLRAGQPLVQEADTFCHELAHLELGHVPRIAPTYAHNMARAIRAGTVKRVTAGPVNQADEVSADTLGGFFFVVFQMPGKIEWLDYS